MTEDEMVGWHHRLNGHELEQTPGVGDGQGSQACCSPWGHKELDMAEKLKYDDNRERCDYRRVRNKVLDLKMEERVHDPRNADILQKLEKARRWTLP